MGSWLGPTIANIFLSSHHEQILLKNCPCEFKPGIYKRYVDDTFLLFWSKDHIEQFDVTLIANILILSLHRDRRKQFYIISRY